MDCCYYHLFIIIPPLPLFSARLSFCLISCVLFCFCLFLQYLGPLHLKSPWFEFNKWCLYMGMAAIRHPSLYIFEFVDQWDQMIVMFLIHQLPPECTLKTSGKLEKNLFGYDSQTVNHQLFGSQYGELKRWGWDLRNSPPTSMFSHYMER